MKIRTSMKCAHKTSDTTLASRYRDFEKASRRSSKGRENLRAKIEKDLGVEND